MLLLPKHLFLPAPPGAPTHSRFRPLACATTTTSTGTASSFSIEDYLTTKCNLYPGVAARVAPELAHLKSPSKPDTVLAFLAGTLGLTPSLLAVTIARDPKLLTCSVEKTLVPRAAELRALGFSTLQMGLLVARAGSGVFRSRTLIPRVRFWLAYLRGRVHKLVLAIKDNPELLTADLRVVKSTIALLQQQCGLTDDDVGWVCVSFASKLLVTDPKEVEAVVARAEELGVARNSRLFNNALITAFCMTPEKIARKVEFFKNEFGWSERQIKTAVANMATVLMAPATRLRRNWEFLTTEVGLDSEQIAAMPALLRYDVDRRLVPRHRVMKVLLARRLLWHERDFRNIAAITEEEFVGKFIRPFLVKIPTLIKIYEAAGAGAAPRV